MEAMSSVAIQTKIGQFEKFINDVLRADLKKLADKLDVKNSEVAEFLQLKSVITTLRNTKIDERGFKTKVDLGNSFFVQAHVEDTSTILLDVGLGHYVEFSLDDAIVLIDVRVKLLESQIAHIRTEISKTNAHIKLILIGIQDLQDLN